MNTTITQREGVKPLAITIGILNIIMALYVLVLFVFFLNNLFDGPFSTPNLGKVVSNAFNFFWIAIVFLLLLWFILMKGRLSNGTRTIAIVGLSILLALDIFATVTNICFTTEKLVDLLTNRIYFISNSLLNLASMIILGIAFITMSHQFENTTGKWALANGVIRLIQALMFLANIIVSFFSTKEVLQILSLTNRIIALAFYITIITFFFKFANNKDTTQIPN